jgi:dienelactone hydrolase
MLSDYHAQRECFRKAVNRLGVVCHNVEIPYDDTTLDGYLVLPDSGGKWPTIVSPSGYDGTAEEMFHYTVSGALGRGYASLIFDGPGQASSLYEKGLVFRPDYEVVLSAVADWATKHKRIDSQQMVLAGRSFGGYLAPRAATGEHRFAALIADPGQYDLDIAVAQRMPKEFYDLIQAKDPKADEGFAEMFKADPHREYFFMARAVAHGIDSPAEYVRAMKDYSVADRAGEIRCPSWIASQADDDQAQRLYDAIPGNKHREIFTEQQGAFGHCEGSATAQFNQRCFDWLDAVLAG